MKPITKEIAKKIINTFSVEIYNPDWSTILSQPFPVEFMGKKYIGKAQSWVFVMIPENAELIATEPTHGKKYPKLSDILEQFNIDSTISIESIIDDYKSIPVTKQYKYNECETCEGVGHFHYYGYDYDCQSCDETGKIRTNETYDDIHPDSSIIFIEEKLKASFVKKYLLDVIEFTECKELKIRIQNPRYTTFVLDDQIIITIQNLKKLVS